MKPVDTILTNIRLFAPEGWDASHDVPCRTLPAHVSQEEIYYSWWRPSFKERLQILVYGFVRLAIWSKTHPPVSVDTYGPDAVEGHAKNYLTAVPQKHLNLTIMESNTGQRLVSLMMADGERCSYVPARMALILM